VPAAQVRCLLPQPVALFSLSCAGLAIQRFVLGEAAVLPFAVFAGHRNGMAAHSKPLEAPWVPFSEMVFGLLTARNRPQSARATHYKPGIPEKRTRIETVKFNR
jgi:hypothetical protein